MADPDKGAKILIVDDEPQIRKLLKVTLLAHRYDIQEASSGEEALLQATMNHPDLILLDLGLPDISGMTVLNRLREWSSVPVIVLTAKDREESKIEALDGGADDYVTKPFGMGELVARIRVALRHVAKTVQDPVLHFDDLMIDLNLRNVTLRGERLKLTPIEYDLLKILATNADKVITQRQLLQQVWGSHHNETYSHYLRVYISHLRKKIESDPAQPKRIMTEPGIGYRFISPE